MDKLTKNEWIAIVVALIVIAFLFFPFFNKLSLSEIGLDGEKIFMSEVKTNEESVGEGREALPGNIISVHYVGKLEDGTVFDSSVERGAPFTFILGAGQVIPGWEKGIVGMHVGGKRTLVIPPQDAYGERGVVNPQTGERIIPENATLTFEVQLLDVQTIE